MNFDKYANVLHHMKIHKENRKYKDLIITKVVDNYKTVGKVLQKIFLNCQSYKSSLKLASTGIRLV